jgi:predicted component of viral defense system (DUF524 family)
VDRPSIRAELRDRGGRVWNELIITDLPGRRSLVERADGTTAMREGGTYHYRIDGEETGLRLEPGELFDSDDQLRRRGRIRPGLSVGRLIVTAEDLASGRVFHTSINIETAKLDQTQEYRQMLGDIAAHASEALLQGFAPTTLELAPSDRSAELLYQRFAALESFVEGDVFAAAIGRIIHQPHQTWSSTSERCPAGTHFPSGSAVARAIVAAGPRTPWRRRESAALTTLPTHLDRNRYEVDVDTAANRFVKFALERWRETAAELARVLDRPDAMMTPGPVRRGRAVAERVIQTLDEVLSHSLFREVGRLAALPTNDQVLLKRVGYRELFRAFALIEVAPALSFDHSELDDLYSASQRNVATLYEFWCYLALTEVVGNACGERQTARAFEPGGDGLSMTLRAGSSSAIRWQVTRGGRALEVSLFFNRTFSVVRGVGTAEGSWSRAMRPDCSLHIRPLNDLPMAAPPGALDVWLHFDAKYRIDNLVEQLTAQADENEAAFAVEAELVESHARTKREDLLKMHAYRDAIARTAGAYVLFPGDDPVHLERFSELLPGLGAFPLRPGGSGTARGSDRLEEFISDVLVHVSQQASQHERDRFWNSAVHAKVIQDPHNRSSVSFLERPPADTEVLVGYIRSPEQRAWIDRTDSYNVRAGGRRGALRLGSRELGAELVLLYERRTSGSHPVTLARLLSWRTATREDLLQAGYPEPGGSRYFVAALEWVGDVPSWLADVDLDELRPPEQPPGAPYVTTWWHLLGASFPVA